MSSRPHSAQGQSPVFLPSLSLWSKLLITVLGYHTASYSQWKQFWNIKYFGFQISFRFWNIPLYVRSSFCFPHVTQRNLKVILHDTLCVCVLNATCYMIIFKSCLCFLSSFLLMYPMGGSGWWLRYLGSYHSCGRLLLPRLWLCSAQATAAIWGVNQQMKDLCLFLPLCLSIKPR